MVFIAIAVLLMAAASWGQSRGGGASSSSSPGVSSSSSSSGSRDAGGSSSVSSVAHSSSFGSYGGEYSSSRSGGRYSSGGYGYVDLTNTSWSSYNTWLQWQTFMNYMRSMYALNYGYFSRFSRNVEPLATPELIKLAYRKPLRLSLQMLDAVDELQQMLQARQDGKQVDKQAIVAKIGEIKELNKRILKDSGLDFLDQRRDKEVSKGIRIDNLDLATVARFREAVADLSTQLKNTYSQSTPAVVSIQSLSQPSFKSLCKEIDKMTKGLESSARRL